MKRGRGENDEFKTKELARTTKVFYIVIRKREGRRAFFFFFLPYQLALVVFVFCSNQPKHFELQQYNTEAYMMKEGDIITVYKYSQVKLTEYQAKDFVIIFKNSCDNAEVSLQ